MINKTLWFVERAKENIDYVCLERTPDSVQRVVQYLER